MNHDLEIQIGYIIKNIYDLEDLKNNPHLYMRDVFENKNVFINLIIPVELKIDNSNIVLKIHNNTYKIPLNLFLKTFLGKAKMFFELIRDEIGIVSYDIEVKKIDNLYKKYNI